MARLIALICFLSLLPRDAAFRLSLQDVEHNKSAYAVAESLQSKGVLPELSFGLSAIAADSKLLKRIKEAWHPEKTEFNFKLRHGSDAKPFNMRVSPYLGGMVFVYPYGGEWNDEASPIWQLLSEDVQKQQLSTVIGQHRQKMLSDLWNLARRNRLTRVTDLFAINRGYRGHYTASDVALFANGGFLQINAQSQQVEAAYTLSWPGGDMTFGPVQEWPHEGHPDPDHCYPKTGGGVFGELSDLTGAGFKGACARVPGRCGIRFYPIGKPVHGGKPTSLGAINTLGAFLITTSEHDGPLGYFYPLQG